MVEYSIGRPLGKYTLGPNETGIMNIKSIANKYDILLVNDNVRSRINIEMNRSVEGEEGIKETYNRNQSYLGHVLADFYKGLDLNARYKDEIMVEQVNFNNFLSPEGNLLFRLDFEFVDRNYDVTRNGVKIRHIYLPRMEDLCYDKEKEDLDIYKDFTLLRSENYGEMEELAKGNKEREEVVKFIYSLREDSDFMSSYVDEEWKEILRATELEEAKEKAIKEGTEQGIKEGYEQGLEKGIKEGIEKMAKELLKIDMPLEQISKVTNLTIDKIEKLKSEIKD